MILANFKRRWVVLDAHLDDFDGQVDANGEELVADANEVQVVFDNGAKF